MSLIIPQQATPTTPAASNNELFVNTPSKQLATIDDAGTVRVTASLDGVETLTNKVITSPLIITPSILGPTITGGGTWTGNPVTTGLNLAAGTVSTPNETFAASTLLTTPAIGAAEFDGTAFYETIDTTSGRAQVPNFQIFRLTADGGALGAGIADYFGANSAFPFVANGVYLFEFHCYFLKTTAGTVTWTLTSTQNYSNLDAFWWGNVITGFGTVGALSGAGVSKQTTAATALPVSGSLTTAVDHYHVIRAVVTFATAGNIRLRVTNSAGTVTPRFGSYYTATRLFAGNVGTFVA